MATQSVVFIVVFTLAFAGIVLAVVKLSAKDRRQDEASEAVLDAHRSQQLSPEGRRQAADAEIVNAKASALGGIEADEAAGRSPEMTGSRVANHRRKVLHEIKIRRARMNRRSAASTRRGPTGEI